MNRNIEQHFSTTPRVNHKRSVFDRSHGHSTSFSFGSCIPIFSDEVLPGDTVSMRTNKIARMQTLLAPIYGNMYLDLYWFFTPYRICWDHYKQFMGENTASAWIPQVEYKIPTLGSPIENGVRVPFASGTIADYIGVPTNKAFQPGLAQSPSRLPFMAYAMICNSFFRDQNLSDPLVVSSNSDANLNGSNGSGLGDVELGGMPYKASKFHDIFTSSLPQPQKGPGVSVPVTGSLPVIAGAIHSAGTSVTPDGIRLATPIGFTQGNFISTDEVMAKASTSTQVAVLTGFEIDADGKPYVPDSTRQFGPTNFWAVSNLSDMARDQGTLGIDINSLRLSIATQQYYEALARSGSRLEEQIATFFGVTNPDSRVQQPEYLGGNRVQLNVREVSNTAQSEQDFLGDLGAQSVTADSHNDFVHSFTEAGVLMCIAVARYDHVYSQGMPRWLTRHDKFDFYNPLFSEIGEQPIYNYEVFMPNNSVQSDKSVFGYNEAWVHYRTAQNRVSGQLRPTGSGNLTHWTIADNYASLPTLSDTWIREDPTNVDRALSVTHNIADQIFADFYFDTKWTRCMPMYSIPGQFGSF